MEKNILTYKQKIDIIINGNIFHIQTKQSKAFINTINMEKRTPVLPTKD